MLTLKATSSMTPATRLRVPSRRRTISVSARSKEEIEAEYAAQQKLLAFRRRKMEARMTGGSIAEVSPATAARTKSKSKSSSAPPPPKAAKAEPKLLVDEDEDAGSGGNPLGFLGKLFGKK